MNKIGEQEYYIDNTMTDKQLTVLDMNEQLKEHAPKLNMNSFRTGFLRKCISSKWLNINN
jgi:hypothetical protein